MEVVVEWLTLLLIWEVLGSNLGPETGYSDGLFGRFFFQNCLFQP
jgi:hypothetical protein